MWPLGFRLPLLRVVVVSLKHDPNSALRGVLWQSRGPWMVLREATAIEGRVERALDGEALVHRENVAFVQVVP